MEPLIGLAEVEKPDVLSARGGVWFGLKDAQLHVALRSPLRRRGRRTPHCG